MLGGLVLQDSALSPYDPLTVSLILLAAGAIIATIYLYREARGRHEPEDHQSFAWMFGLIGGISLLISGEIMWANWAGFPAAQYTELFGVAQTLFAVVMLAAAFVLYTDLDVKPFTWLTAISGLVLLQGGRAIYSYGLTREPWASTGIWIATGIAAVLLLPASYAGEGTDARKYLLYATVVFLIVAAVLSGGMGIEAHFGHIAEAASGS
ncbi:MAG: DUF981 domain-containing protein [Haloarculaceae archaeon]